MLLHEFAAHLQRAAAAACLFGLIADNVRQRRLRNFTGEAGDAASPAKMVLSHNYNDSDARGGISCGHEAGVAMEKVQHCRAMGSLFRQFAVFDPLHSWKYLIEAQKWEHFAEAEIASNFKERNTTEAEAPRDC
jgi:hypothetical protein